MSALSLNHLVSWALEGGPAPVELTDASVQRIVTSHEHLRTAGRSGAVYGLTTGVGALRNVPTDVTPGDGTSHALRLWRSHATGYGETYDDATARAALAIRLHQITSGRSGVSGDLAASLGAAVASGAVPELHRFGSIGTGDLVPLAQLGLTLVGERPWRSGSAPVAQVDDGDALPFMSSNAAALRASWQAYDPRVHVGRPDASQQAVARRLMALLQPVGAAWVPARIQDPFALRTVPQVHAPFLDALVTTEQAVLIEVDDSTENPLVADDGTPLHHGGFVTARLSATLDALRQAMYPVMALSAARLSALINPSLSGLPAFLASGPPGSSGVMILEYLAQDALARARILTAPVSTGHAVLSLGLEEHASFSTQAAWACEQVVGLAPLVLGCELVTVVRALRMDPVRLPDSPLREVYDAAAGALSEERSDRPFDEDLATAARLVAEGLQT